MPDIYFVMITVASIIIVSVLAVYVDNKSGITDRLLKDVKSTKEIALLILDVLNLDNQIKDKSKFVLDLADRIAEYSYAVAKDKDKRYELAIELLDELTLEFGLNLSESEEKLAQIVISESLKWLEKHQNSKEKP